MFIPSTRSLSLDRFGVQSGFSLIEMLIVLVIIGVLLGIATPSLSNFFDKQRNNEATQTLVAAFREARTESQLRRQDIIFRLNDNNVTLVAAGDTKPIRQFPLQSVVSVSSQTPSIVFKSNKSVRLPAGSSSSATTFTYTVVCNVKSSKEGSSVVVDNNGNVKIDNGASQCS